jgi:general secretion pathway protein G
MPRTIASASDAHLTRFTSARSGINPTLRGFTLLELLVVIVIIGLLAGLVVPRYFDTVTKSKIKVARAQMSALDKALEQYRLDVGSLPTPEQGLDALITAPAITPRWQGPYLKKAIPLDPWGNAYIYQLSATQRDADIISLGSDGKPGGTGDAKDIYLSADD